MDLNDDDIQAFVDAWREVFHESLPLDQARTVATRLLTLYKCLIDDHSPPAGSAEQPSISHP